MKKIDQKNQQELIIYRGPKGNVSLRAQIEKETLWASLNQIAEVFGVQKAAVSKHIKNIFETGELARKATVSILETVQTEGKRSMTRKIEYYNLDMIIAVGYRVNSKQATQFRIWATETLRDYIFHGYVLDRQRLIESKQNTLKELEKTVAFIQSVATRKYLEQDEMTSLLSVIRDYANSFDLLHEFDSGSVQAVSGKGKLLDFSYDEVAHSLAALKRDLIKRGEASELFGVERDAGLSSIIGNIHQAFGGKSLYPSVESRAAHLLYFVIKDHPLVDGNKRTGAFLFILFLQKHKALHKKNGEKKINDRALTALALLVAGSDPKEKDQLIALITQLIA